MQADQAAGLRRRRDASPTRGIYCFFDSGETVTNLAQALQRLGSTVLLVDACGRHFAHTTTRSLFDWEQQLARGQLLIQPTAFGDGWLAPGILAKTPAWDHVALDYDPIVIDAGPLDTQITFVPDAIRLAVLSLADTTDSKLRAFSLIKTLVAGNPPFSVCLFGEPKACGHVMDACRRFLAPVLTQTIYAVAQEGDAFTTLAVRMLAEEASLTTRYKTGQT